MAEYTITEALVKLKLAEKKIADATAQTLTGFVAAKGSTVAPGGFKTVDDYKSEIKRRLDSVTGLITFRDKLKKALVESNAATQVVVGSKTMSVAEAIEKKSSIASRKNLVDKLSREWQAMERDAYAKNAQLEQKADTYVTQLFSQNPSANAEDKENARKAFVLNNSAYVVTSDNMKSYIEALQAEIEEFTANVDVALSVTNAKTLISVPD